MLFYEPVFLFVFLPAAFTIYALLSRFVAARIPILLAASGLFYTWGEPAFVPVVIASAAVDYALGRRIAAGARWAVTSGVLANVAVLVFYKYLDVILANAWPGGVGPWPQIALPIGVSFIVFEKITYLVDIARHRSAPAASFAQYLAYVMFFPKLLAGPIVKYHEIDAQFRRPAVAGEGMVLAGFLRFMQGVIKKILLADVLGIAADAAFALPPDAVGFSDAWSGVVLFTLQIYFDFSAYSDMAIGLARMFGFRLPENFNMPYISCSITEFWRRWHISLSTWIRAYLYTPLGGNRVAAWRVIVNLWICFLASGLWHGAAWNYVLWGAYNGVFLTAERLFLLRVLDRFPRVLANAFALVVVMVGWAVFRAGSMVQLGAFLMAMVDPARWGGTLVWGNDTRVTLVVGGVLALAPRVPGVMRAVHWALGVAAGRFAIEAAATLLFIVAVSKAVADPFRPFLYFRF